MPRLTPQPASRLVRIFERLGFTVDHMTGDHIQMTRAGSRTLVIPNRREVPVFVILNNLRSAGVSRDRYFEILESL